MLLNCDVEPRRYRRGTLERLRVALAHLIYGRVAMLGDPRVAFLSMGAFYARTGEPQYSGSSDLDAAADVLTAKRDAVASASDADPAGRCSDECLLLAAFRVGCAVVRLEREAGEARDGRAEALRRLDARTLDRRLVALLADTGYARRPDG